MKEDLADGAMECMELFKKTLQKPWIASGDSKDSVIQTAVQLNLIKISDEALEFAEDDRESLNMVFKNYLTEIKASVLKSSNILIDKSYTSMNSKIPDARKSAAKKAGEKPDGAV